MAVLVLNPKLGFTEDNQNTETPIKLGDGYLLPGRVNGSDRKSYQVSGILTESEMLEMVALLESYGGGKVFQWQPIPEIAQRNFWCDSFGVTPLGADWREYQWELSAKFEEAR